MIPRAAHLEPQSHGFKLYLSIYIDALHTPDAKGGGPRQSYPLPPNSLAASTVALFEGKCSPSPKYMHADSQDVDRHCVEL